MIRAVVFDFDGTLTELTLDFSAMRKEVERLAEKYVGPDSIRRFDGLFMLEMIYGIETILGDAGARFREEAFALLRKIEIEAADGKDVYPYARDVLRGLRERKLKIGVMTRNCTGALRKVFPDVDAYVDASVTREEIRVVKPHPSHPLAVLRLLGVDPSEAFLVGDHPTDILAGRASGIRTVGVLSGRTERAGFENAEADYIIRDIRDLSTVVTNEDDR